MSTAAMFQESNETWRRLRLQQILYKSVLNNDLDMVLKCVQHGADIREEYLPVSDSVVGTMFRGKQLVEKSGFDGLIL